MIAIDSHGSASILDDSPTQLKQPISMRVEAITIRLDSSTKHPLPEAPDLTASRTLRVEPAEVVRSVSCGEHHVGAVSEVGILYTWGRGADQARKKHGLVVFLACHEGP